jgi:putative flippase GtrA
MLSEQTWSWSAQRARVPGVARRFSKFGVVGASGLGVNLTLFWLLMTVLDWHYLAASAASIEVALCSNYVLNNNWTFVDRRTKRFSFSGLARYHAVSLGGMAINLTVLYIFADRFGVHPMIANLAGIAVATFWNFSLNLCWTWRRRTLGPGNAMSERTPSVTPDRGIEHRARCEGGRL